MLRSQAAIRRCPPGLPKASRRSSLPRSSTDATGARGDNLPLNRDSYAELSPGLSAPRPLRKPTADMLGDLPYMTSLQVVSPANRPNVILYKRDIGGGQPLSHTLQGYHYPIELALARLVDG
jgi:hypothetical protein